MKHDVILLMLSLRHSLYYEETSRTYVAMCLSKCIPDMDSLTADRAIEIIEGAFKKGLLTGEHDQRVWNEMLLRLESVKIKKESDFERKRQELFDILDRLRNEL